MLGGLVFLIIFGVCSVHCNVTSTCGQRMVCNSYLDLAVDMIMRAKYNLPACPENRNPKAADCADIFQMGHSASGVYEIWPQSRITEGKSLVVYCDMDTDGGGWTVILRRGDFHRPKDYFNRDWKSYKEGFGDIKYDFWLGNDNIFAVTNHKLHSARFDMKDFEQNKRYALYDKFWIDDENNKYTLHIAEYRGDAGDDMAYHDNQSFSTKDKDNDKSSKNCGDKHKGGWWYKSCHVSNLNGLYHKEKLDNNDDGITWSTWTGYNDSLQWAEFKIRPKNFSPFYQQ